MATAAILKKKIWVAVKLRSPKRRMTLTERLGLSHERVYTPFLLAEKRRIISTLHLSFL